MLFNVSIEKERGDLASRSVAVDPTRRHTFSAAIFNNCRSPGRPGMASCNSLHLRYISWLLSTFILSLLLWTTLEEEDPHLLLHVNDRDASISVLKQWAFGNEKKVGVSRTAAFGSQAEAKEIWIDYDSERSHDNLVMRSITAAEGHDIAESEKRSGKKKVSEKVEQISIRVDRTENEAKDGHKFEHDQMDGRMTDPIAGKPSGIKNFQATPLSGSFFSNRHILEKAKAESDTRPSEFSKEVKNEVTESDSKPVADKKDDATDSVSPKTTGINSSPDAELPKQNPTEDNSGKVNEGNGQNQISKQKADEPSNGKTKEDEISKQKPDEASRINSDNGTSNGKPDKDNVDKKREDDGPKKVSVSDQDGNAKQQTDCDSIHSCGDGKKMLACLRTSGDGTQELSLLVQNKGDNPLRVKVITPEFLSAEPSFSLAIEKGKSATVQILVVDLKAAKLADSSVLNITTDDYDCSIEVPILYLGNMTQRSFFQGFSYPYMTKHMAIVYMLLFVLVGAAVGVWLYCRYGRRRRRGDSGKYQELEIGDLHQNRVNKSQGDNLDGWDEIWDDSWEDTEAARLASRPIKNLSSKGLASRKGNKEGWETSWDDQNV